MRPHLDPRPPNLESPILTGAYSSFFHLRLITSQDRRLAVEQIRKHPFFYGVDWASIRNIEAPFIPRLRSITDTSYFPTDELDQVPDEPTGGDTTGAHKELAFLGYVLSSHSSIVVFDHSLYMPQLYIQEVHAFFQRFLIAVSRRTRFLFFCGTFLRPAIRIQYAIVPFYEYVT